MRFTHTNERIKITVKPAYTLRPVLTKLLQAAPRVEHHCGKMYKHKEMYIGEFQSKNIFIKP